MKHRQNIEDNVGRNPVVGGLSITGDSNRDWRLWQLVQVIKEIAQTKNEKPNKSNLEEGLDN